MANRLTISLRSMIDMKIFLLSTTSIEVTDFQRNDCMGITYIYMLC